MNTLTFDIETIPQNEESLSKIQEEEIEKKMERYLVKRPHEDEGEAKKMLMATSPYFGEIITIGLHRHTEYGDEDSIALIGSEEEILSRFWENIKSFNGLFISFNGISFDVPFISKRSMKHRITPSNTKFLDTYKFQKRPHFDVKSVISDFNNWVAPTLKLTCDLLDVPSPKGGGVEAKNVAQAFHNGRIDEIADYCEKDVKATFECYKKMIGYFKS